MPLFTKNNFNVFYVHIPRTSGRYLRELFVANRFDSKYDEFSKNSLIGEFLPTHLHYPAYNYYLSVEKFSHFTIVRNPVDKVWSALNVVYGMHNPKDFFKNLENKQWFFDYIDYERSTGSYHNNWFMPQCNFISHKTYIYKYENGINQNFFLWFNKTFFEEIKEYDVKYYKMNAEKNLNKKYEITKKIKDNIKDYYIDDFKKFNY